MELNFAMSVKLLAFLTSFSLIVPCKHGISILLFQKLNFIQLFL